MNDHTTTTELPPPAPTVRASARADPSVVATEKPAGGACQMGAAADRAGGRRRRRDHWYLTKDEASTDDAYTDGRAITVAPQVAGTVVALHVTDNQRVKAGDVLLEIDPRAYAAAREQAQGSLQVAEAQLANARINLEWAKQDYPAKLAAAQASLAAARAGRFKADADARRQRGLPKQATTQQEIDTANAALRTADAQVDQAQAAVRQAELVPQYHRPGRGPGAPARGAGGAGPRPARSGDAEPVMDPHHRPAGRLDHQAQRRAGQLRAGRPVHPVDRHARRSGSPPTSRNRSSTACAPARRWISASMPIRA